MAEKVEDLTINYEEDGILLTRETDKKILTKGSWATVMFLYQDMDRKSGEYGDQKIRIVRYQKVKGQYLPRSKFNISSAKQARLIAATIRQWFPEKN